MSAYIVPTQVAARSLEGQLVRDLGNYGQGRPGAPLQTAGLRQRMMGKELTGNFL